MILLVSGGTDRSHACSIGALLALANKHADNRDHIAKQPVDEAATPAGKAHREQASIKKRIRAQEKEIREANGELDVIKTKVNTQLALVCLVFFLGSPHCAVSANLP